MGTYRYGDLRDETYLLRSELHEVERADAWYFVCRRAPLRDARPPGRRVRVWLGTVLLVADQRLLASAPAPAGPA